MSISEELAEYEEVFIKHASSRTIQTLDHLKNLGFNTLSLKQTTTSGFEEVQSTSLLMIKGGAYCHLHESGWCTYGGRGLGVDENIINFLETYYGN